jgi:hypothetical protein
MAELTALAVGYLHGDRKTGCLWLSTQKNPERTQLLLHGDYRVGFDERGVFVREHGSTVAREGDRVSVGGGLSGSHGVTGCPVTGENLWEGWHLAANKGS